MNLLTPVAGCALALMLAACDREAAPGRARTPADSGEAARAAAPNPAQAAPRAAADLTMPGALLGKWKKDGGNGWHVFESQSLHYWTDGRKRLDHRISLKERNGEWFIYWAEIERPPEKVEITASGGKIRLHTIPTVRGGFLQHFSDETFVKVTE